MALFNSAEAEQSSGQNSRSILEFIMALVCMPLKFAKRLFCISLAAMTRLRISALLSSWVWPLILDISTGVTSICKSILSISGPDMRFMYLATAPLLHRHSFVGWL